MDEPSDGDCYYEGAGDGIDDVAEDDVVLLNGGADVAPVLFPSLLLAVLVVHKSYFQLALQLTMTMMTYDDHFHSDDVVVNFVVEQL